MTYQEQLEKKLAEGLKSEKSSPFGFFITHFRFTYLILIIITIFGFYSISSLPKEANPEVNVPYAVVNTIYPGANPTDVEELITDKLESRIKNLDNLKRYTSGTGIGISTIFVEFEAGVDIDKSIEDLKDAVDLAKPELPGEAEDPMVSEISFSDFPIVTYSLVGDFSLVELKKSADFLQEEFESIRDVSKVVILGDLEKEFRVEVSQDKLANFGISMGQIANAISLNNFNLPSGNIEVEGFKYNVRVKGKFENIEDLKNIVIRTSSETPIYLKDIANVIDTYKEKTTESRIGFKDELPRNTISLQVYKKTGGNILNIVQGTQDKINELTNAGKFSDDLKIQKTNDNAVFIKEDLRTLGGSAVQTMILITIILMFVLSTRGAIITALSIPFAFLITFTVIYLQGGTLNSLALFSLVIALGLMVDNSIIIIEGISEYTSKHGKGVCESALLSVWNYKWPIIAGTMTTVSAFLPMLLVSGIMGEFISTLPKTISAALISSLFVALVIIPTLITRFMHDKTNGDSGGSQRDKKRHQRVAKVMGYFQNLYEKQLTEILPNKKKRRRVIKTAWLAFIIAVLIPFFGILEVEMFSPIDNDYAVVNISLPVGSSLEKTKEITAQVEAVVDKIPELDNYVTNLGTSASVGMTDSTSMGGSSDNSHLSSITVNFTDKDKRKRKSYEISEVLRNELKNFSQAEVKVEEIGAGPPTGAPIELRVTGTDMKELSLVGEEVKNIIRNINGTINVTDNIQDSTGDFVFTVNKQKANFYGLSTVEVASTIRSAIYGQKASEINIDGDDVDITITYDEAKFKTIDDIENILLFSPSGQNVKLKEVVDTQIEASVLAIAHRDGDKVITIRSDIEPNANLQNILKEFDLKIAELTLPEGYAVDVGGEVEDIEQSFREIFLSMILSIILITIILVLQFNSFRQPFIILFTLPLAVIGVIAGLVILGLPFSFTAFLGIVALSGIVVNDAIVLIDKINKNVDLGMEMVPAIIEGGKARMQPILLTTLTTVAGVFPLIFASELWIGLSISVIFGLSFASVLSLIMIPILYQGFTDKK
ncbi:hypothetical protein C0584_05340 [Candidatus Parcubacteria bacterium]|nr:MAG: hypothetical protein C0584_05340 [Candidatus Parcubacteria bacterium]